MKRIALILGYDGSHFSGWQTQSGGGAIQDALEASLAALAGHPLRVTCAGRTDAGVHATAQVVHFDTDTARPVHAWVRGTNARLPAAVAVLHAQEVDPDFHARFSARSRRYVYLIHRAAVRHPLWVGRAGWVFRDLDVAAMRAGARRLVGEHDFSAFRSSQCQAKTPVRRIESLTIDESGALLALCFEGNAFLHHMVRNIVGSLVYVGTGRHPEHWIGAVLEGRDRSLAAPTFSAEGLYLQAVTYDEHFGLPTPPPGMPLWQGASRLE